MIATVLFPLSQSLILFFSIITNLNSKYFILSLFISISPVHIFPSFHFNLNFPSNFQNPNKGIEPNIATSSPKFVLYWIINFIFLIWFRVNAISSSPLYFFLLIKLFKEFIFFNVWLYLDSFLGDLLIFLFWDESSVSDRISSFMASWYISSKYIPLKFCIFEL